MDEMFKTSQTIWSLPEGQNPVTATQPDTSEPTGAPGPVTQPIKGEIIQKGIPTISQTEHHLPEG